MSARDLFRVVPPVKDVLRAGTADTRADGNARAIVLVFLECETRIAHGFGAGDERELGEAVEHINRYTRQMFFGIEVGNFRGDLHAQQVGVAQADAARAAARRHQPIPECAEADTHRGDDSHTGNGDASHIEVRPTARAW